MRTCQAPDETLPGLQTSFARSDEGRFVGFVFDPDDPLRKFSVDILIDGYSIRLIRADAYVHELASRQIGDACYGFWCSLPDNVIGDGAVVEARLANLSIPVGTPVVLSQAGDSANDPEGPGELRWLGGLRFSGWIAEVGDATTANVLVDGTRVSQVRCSSFSHVGNGLDDGRVVRAFDLHVPQRFADGALHQLAVLTERGENVRGSPLAFLAFADGLRATVAKRGLSHQDLLRAELFDRLVPMAVPFSH